MELVRACESDELLVVNLEAMFFLAARDLCVDKSCDVRTRICFEKLLGEIVFVEILCPLLFNELVSFGLGFVNCTCVHTDDARTSDRAFTSIEWCRFADRELIERAVSGSNASASA